MPPEAEQNGDTSGATSSTETPPAELDCLTWTERHLTLRGRPERVPAPIRAIYREPARMAVVMKGAQLTISEYALNLSLHTADTSRADRGTALYVMPGGSNVGNFVQMRVLPVIEGSAYLIERSPKPGSRDPDSIGLRRVGDGYVAFRTAYVKGRGARNTSGLKSIPADTLVLDEFDEMPEGTYDIAKHRLDSSEEALVRIISTPTFANTGVHALYLAGTRLRYHLTCEACGHRQYLEWEANVLQGEDGALYRGCSSCAASMEDLISRAWEATDEAEALGAWLPTNAEGEYPSYHISQLYRPNIDLREMKRGLESPKLETQQEAWNQNLGLPWNPPGGRFPYVREYFEHNRYDAADRAYVNKCIARWISFDTAMKDKKTNDYTAWTVGELLPDYRLVVREVRRERMQFPALPGTIEDVAQRYNRDGKLRGVLIEDKASGTSAYQTLMQTAPDWLQAMLVAFQPSGSKLYRAQQSAVWAKAGCVLLPWPGDAAPWLPVFEDELFTFDGQDASGSHDDQVDSFDQLILYIEHYLAEGYRVRQEALQEASGGY